MNNPYGGRKIKFKVDIIQKERPGFLGFFEGLFYEVKPLLYLTLVFWVTSQHFIDTWYTKFACMIILLFCTMVVYSRLSYRGYIENN